MKAEEDKKKIRIKAKQAKNCKTSQINSMKRFALGNSQIRSLKDVPSDFLVSPSRDLIESSILI